VTVDAGTLIGNEHLLPRGVLRESPYGLKRAHALIVTRFDHENRDKIQRTVRYFDRRVPIILERPYSDRPAGARYRYSARHRMARW
jgi:tetraacyldisaccharide-1-P 4'-kinase